MTKNVADIFVIFHSLMLAKWMFFIILPGSKYCAHKDGKKSDLHIISNFSPNCHSDVYLPVYINIPLHVQCLAVWRECKINNAFAKMQC